MLNLVGKIYARILVHRVHRVTGGLINDEERGFRAGRGYVDHTFTLKQIDEKHERKKRSVSGFYRFGEGV